METDSLVHPVHMHHHRRSELLQEIVSHLTVVTMILATAMALVCANLMLTALMEYVSAALLVQTQGDFLDGIPLTNASVPRDLTGES
jgi:hypothetical protein